MKTAPLTHLREVSLFMRSTALFVLVTFAGLILEPTVAAATTTDDPLKLSTPNDRNASTAEEQLSETIQAVQERVDRLRDKLAKKQDVQTERDELKSLKTRVEDLDADVEASFDQTLGHLKSKNLPDVILQRHAEAVAKYKQERDTLLQNLSDIETATSEDDLKAKVEKAKQHLDSKQHKRTQQSFDPNNLPFGSPDGKVRKPKKTKQEFNALFETNKPVQIASTSLFPGILATGVVTAAALPQASDLAPTEDVQITPEIEALATQLEHHPVKIYNWVYDNIEFLPTYGSIQGSQMTLDSKKGNAFDTASLLIALLRASNIPARYAYGTVKIPADKVMNWVGGVTVPEAALDILGQGGIPSAGILAGGKITHIEMEHVWVEAYVDFVPSRGARHKEGDTWIPMDGSFKQYSYQKGVVHSQAVTFDTQGLVTELSTSSTVNDAEGWFSGTDRRLISSRVTQYADAMRSYLAANQPNASFLDLVGRKLIRTEPRSMLSASLPYVNEGTFGIYASLPSQMRHSVSVRAYNSNVERSLAVPSYSHTMSFPSLATKRFGLTFVPATTDDAATIQSYKDQGATRLPIYLIKVVPSITLDGAVVSQGQAISMGQLQQVDVVLTGNQSVVVPFTVVAGDEVVFGLTGNGVAPELIVKRSQQVDSQSAAENLHQVALHYWMEADFLDQVAAKGHNVVAQRLPSVGLFSSRLNINYLFGLPSSGFYKNRVMDVKRSAIAVAGLSTESKREFLVQSGYQGSYLEGDVFDQLFRAPSGSSVSATRILGVANDIGLRIYTVSQQNVSTVLPSLNISQTAKAEIQSAVGVGKIAIVPDSQVTHGAWRGTGYVIQDPVKGTGAYLIDGGLNGSEENNCDSKESVEPSHSAVAVAAALFVVAILMTLLILAAIPLAAPVVLGTVRVALTILMTMPALFVAEARAQGALPYPDETCSCLENLNACYDSGWGGTVGYGSACQACYDRCRGSDPPKWPSGITIIGPGGIDLPISCDFHPVQ